MAWLFPYNKKSNLLQRYIYNFNGFDMSFGQLSKGYVNSGEFGDYQNIRFPEIPKANSLSLLRFNPRKLAYKQNSNNSLISGQVITGRGPQSIPRIRFSKKKNVGILVKTLVEPTEDPTRNSQPW